MAWYWAIIGVGTGSDMPIAWAIFAMMRITNFGEFAHPMTGDRRNAHEGARTFLWAWSVKREKQRRPAARLLHRMGTWAQVVSPKNQPFPATPRDV